MIILSLFLSATEYQDISEILERNQNYRRCQHLVIFSDDVDADWKHLWLIEQQQYVKTTGQRYIASYIDNMPYFFNKSFDQQDELNAFVKYYDQRWCASPVLGSQNDFQFYNKLAIFVFNKMGDHHIQRIREIVGTEYQIGFSGTRYMNHILKEAPKEVPYLLIKNSKNEINVHYLNKTLTKENIINTISAQIGDFHLQKPLKWDEALKLQFSKQKQEL